MPSPTRREFTVCLNRPCFMDFRRQRLTTSTAKAILNNPSTYEILDPSDFGMTRYVSFISRLTGWNAIKTRVEQLGLDMTDDQIKEVYVFHNGESSFLRWHLLTAFLFCTERPRSRPWRTSVPLLLRTAIPSSSVSLLFSPSHRSPRQ